MRSHLWGGMVGVALLAVTACAPRPARGPVASHDRLSGQRMVEVEAATVYDAVQKLRPNWLSGRGPRSLTDSSPAVANVVVAGQVVGDIQFLRNLRPEQVDYLRFWRAGEASVRWGMNNARGVIEVVLKSGGGM